jgi:hypothetical protein
MQPIKIKSGTKEVIASGTVISFEGNPIGFEIENIKFIFEFVDEEGKAGTDVNFTSPEERTLKITLKNFKNPLGTGNQKPMAVGTFHGLRLFLSYRVYQLEGSDKTLDYTFYTEGEVV